MSKILITTLSIALYSFPILAVSIDRAPAQAQDAPRCADLKSCLAVFAKMTGQHYMSKTELKGGYKIIGGLAIKRELADYYTSLMLFHKGYARYQLENVPGTFIIVEGNEISDSPFPRVALNSGDPLNLPSTWDYYILDVKLKHPENLDRISGLLRRNISRKGKIFNLDAADSLRIVDAVPYLRKTYDLITAMDVQASKEVLRQWKKRNRRRK